MRCRSVGREPIGDGDDGGVDVLEAPGGSVGVLDDALPVEQVVGTGDTVFLPRGTAHAFRVEDDGTQLLEINTPGGFEGFHLAAGEPAAHDGLPEPKAPDIENRRRRRLQHPGTTGGLG